MADDNNILIEIRSAFEKSGTDAAERAQDNLKRKTEDTSKAFERNQGAVNSAQKALGGLTAASAASQGSFGGLSRVLENFSGRLADLATKATLVAGAFSAGYGIGTAIDKWLGISKAVADAYAPMEKVASIQDRIKAQLAGLNAASLAAVKTQFDALSSSLEKTMSQMDRLNRLQSAVASAEGEAQLAEIEASMPPGPARDRAILTKRREIETGATAKKLAVSSKKLHESEQAVAAGRTVVTGAESEEGEARKSLMLMERSDSGATLEQKAMARQKLNAAELKSKTAATAQKALEAQHLELSETTAYETFATLGEDRASKARFVSGGKAITLREQEDAEREREKAQQKTARQLGIREGLSNELRDIGTQATRSALSSQLGDLGERREELFARGMPAARVADLRAKAAGTYKQADSAVAAVAQVLDSITARMKSLEEKLKNLPR